MVFPSFEGRHGMQVIEGEQPIRLFRSLHVVRRAACLGEAGELH
jgi:hypothetical protein